MVSIYLLQSVDLANSLLTNKISMRAIINRVPVPRHVRFPVCPPFMVLTGQHNIPVQWNKNPSKLNYIHCQLMYTKWNFTLMCTGSDNLEVWWGYLRRGGVILVGSWVLWRLSSHPPQVFDQSVNIKCGSVNLFFTFVTSRVTSSLYKALFRKKKPNTAKRGRKATKI